MFFKGFLRFWLVGMLCIAINGGCKIHRLKTNTFLNREALIDVKSIAVLPFHNLSKSVNAGVIVTNMIIVELVRCGKFRVIKYGDMRNFFMQRRFISVPAIDVDTLRALRQEFKVDIVIIGTVFRYENVDKAGGRNRDKRTYTPSVAISSTILDTRSGRILGKGEFTERGSEKGYLLSNKKRQDTFALAQRLAKKLIATLDTDGA